MLEYLSIILVVGILSVNTVSDVKYRTIIGKDRIYFMLGVIGFSLFLFTNYENIWIPLLSLVGSITIVLLLWRFKLVASGDIVICLVICVSLPTVFGIMFFPLFMIFGALFLSTIIITLLNATLNVSTVIHNRPLFSQYNTSIFKNMVSIGLVHHRRSWDKHSISVESHNGYSLTKMPYHQKFSDQKELVMFAIPLIPFLLVSCIILLVTFSPFFGKIS